MAKYPEIERLEEFISANDVVITPIPDRYLDQKRYFTKVEFRIRTKTFILFVDDEFEDLKLNKPPLSLCVVLREIEGVHIEGPYPNWCKALNLDESNTAVRNPYDNLLQISKDLKALVGTYVSIISDFDVTLNAGEAQELRERY